MMNRFELIDKGFIPKTNFKYGIFHKGFNLPKTIFASIWKQLPLYINIRYTYPIDGVCTLKEF